MATSFSIPILDEHTVAYVAELVGVTKSALLDRKGKKDCYSVDNLHITALFQQGVRHV
jgi:hypothetical protein